jgi:predicted DNA binding protein
MTLYEIGFKIQHDCPYNDLSRRHPEALIAIWCNWQKHVMEIHCKDLDLFQSIQEDLKNHESSLGGQIVRKAFSETNVQLVLQSCGCDSKNNITQLLDEHNCLEIQPTIYTGGWEQYRITAFNQKDIKSFFDTLANSCTAIEILSRKTIAINSVREAFIISADSLFSELTGKQSQALLAALERGYYRVPKKTTADEIASDLGLPRTTFEEHLRKAESKVFRAITPYMQMRNGFRS